MTVDNWLLNNQQTLDKSGIATARLDALVLLEDATGKDRSWLLAHHEHDVKGSTLHRLQEQIEKRCQHIPLAQIRGKTEFYGREFIINEHVLEPRPESETMIELLKELVNGRQFTVDRQLHIIDVGTGSGALGITAKLELPDTKVTAIDVDQECLRIARKNARKHSVEIDIVQSDLLTNLSILDERRSKRESIVLANLPYVPDDFTVNNAALNEPKIAIFGGPDGLDIYRRLFQQINKKQHVKYIFTESLPFQHKELEKIAKSAGYKLIKEDDFIQVFQKS